MVKANEEPAIKELLEMYKPLMIKRAIIDTYFDEDLYQELCITLIKCIRGFET